MEDEEVKPKKKHKKVKDKGKEEKKKRKEGKEKVPGYNSIYYTAKNIWQSSETYNMLLCKLFSFWVWDEVISDDMNISLHEHIPLL